MMDLAARTIRLVLELRQQGITDTSVLSAIERVPREAFVMDAFRDRAYENTALPIACGQTISQPFIVAYMLQILDLNPRMKVLEIGTGSGYQTAVLARLCRRVYTIEREKELLKGAETVLNDLKIRNYTALCTDGCLGWPQQAPFDRIVVSAAGHDIPKALLTQLSPDGGILVMPVAKDAQDQIIVKVTKNQDQLKREETIGVRFVPLITDKIHDGPLS